MLTRSRIGTVLTKSLPDTMLNCQFILPQRKRHLILALYYLLIELHSFKQSPTDTMIYVQSIHVNAMLMSSRIASMLTSHRPAQY